MRWNEFDYRCKFTLKKLLSFVGHFVGQLDIFYKLFSCSATSGFRPKSYLWRFYPVIAMSATLLPLYMEICVYLTVNAHRIWHVARRERGKIALMLSCCFSSLVFHKLPSWLSLQLHALKILYESESNIASKMLECVLHA